VSVIMMTAYTQADEEHGPAICVICKRPIPPGRGRFRTEEGDVHEECYRERERREKSRLRPMGRGLQAARLDIFKRTA
jgi:hypothetical protein